MPQTINFPASLDDDTSLYVVANNLRTRLTSAIDDSVTTIPVVTTSGFPDVGFVTILTGANILNSEAIAYSGTDTTNFLNAERGSDDTAALEHFATNNVDFTIVSRHHNNLKDAIINIEEYLGVSGSENFVPFVDGNVTLPGTLSVQDTLTGSGIVNFEGDQVGVSGSLEVLGDALFIGSCVEIQHPGKLNVGPLASPLPPVIFASSDAQQTTTSSSFTSVGINSDPTISGIEYAVFWTASLGGNNTIDFNEAKLLLGNTELGFLSSRNRQPSESLTRDGVCGLLAGMTVVTGTGDSFDMEYRNVSGPGLAAFAAAAVVAWPIGKSFIKDVDYFFEVQNDSTFRNDISLGFGGADNTQLEATFDIVKAGDYIFWASCETRGAGAGSGPRVRFSVDDVYVGTEWFRGNTAESSIHPFCDIRRVNLTKGNHTFKVEVASNTTAFSDFRRGRILIMREDALQQSVQDTRSTSFTTFSQVYGDFGLDITYTPTQDETVLIFANTLIARDTTNVHPLTKLRNITLSQNYRLDSGNWGGQDSAGESILPHFQVHSHDMTSGSAEQIQWQVKTEPFESAQGTHYGLNATSGTDTPDTEFWMISSQPAIPSPIEFVTIRRDSVIAPKVTADCIDVSGLLTSASGIFADSLTVSGLSVDITGGGGGGASTLQDAYDNGDGTISIIGGKPLQLTGVGDLVAVTGTFSTSLTVSGIPVSTGTLTVRETDSDPLVTNVTTIVVTTGTLTDDGGGQVTIDTSGFGGGGGGSTITIKEVDGVPSVNNVTTIVVSNDTLTDDTGGQVTILTGGSGGSGAGEVSAATVTTSTGIDASNTVNTPLFWDTESFDEGDWFDASTDSVNFIVPATGVSHIRAILSVRWEDSTVGRRLLRIKVDGTQVSQDSDDPITSSTAAFVHHTSTPVIAVSGGETIGAEVFQDTAGLLEVLSNTNTFFSVFSMGGAGTALTVEEQDGSPSVANVNTIKVTNDTLTNEGGGVVRIDTGGGGGGATTISGREFSGALVALSGGDQTILTGETSFIDFDHTEYDTDGYFTASSGQALTVPTGQGITHVVLKAQAFWNSDAGDNTVRSMNFRRDYQRLPLSSEIQSMGTPSASVITQVVSAPIEVNDGDEFEIAVFQNSGSSIALESDLLRTWFSIENVTPVSGTGGGGGASTLQEAYDGGDGTITTTALKPVELDGTGELTAVTGTFTTGLTIGNGSTDIYESSITTGAGIFTDSLVVANRSFAFSGAQATLSGSDQPVPEADGLIIPFDHAQLDTDGYFTTSSGQVLTVPDGLGITHVRVSAQVMWDGDTSSPITAGRRDLLILKNYARLPQGNSEVRTLAPGSDQIVIHQAHSAPIPVVAGDQFSVQVFHNAGADLNVRTSIGRTWIAIEAL